MSPGKTLAILLGVSALSVHAQPAQQVYKHVDEQGRVTYSQTPPAKDAKRIDVPPPRKIVPRGPDYEREVLRRQAYEDRRLQHERAQHERQEALEQARRKHEDSLRAECLTNRGSDCNDPQTLRRMETDRGPSRYRPTAGRGN